MKRSKSKSVAVSDPIADAVIAKHAAELELAELRAVFWKLAVTWRCRAVDLAAAGHDGGSVTECALETETALRGLFQLRSVK